MIKLDYEAIRKGEEIKVKCEGHVEGEYVLVITEIEAVLEKFEEEMPREFAIALGMFLSGRQLDD